MRIILLSCLIFVGCNTNATKQTSSERFTETDEYMIPDSNKQKYTEFVSKSISGCEDDCYLLFNSIKEEGGRMFGCKKYDLRMRSNRSGMWDSVIPKKDMNSRQLEMVSDFCVE